MNHTETVLLYASHISWGYEDQVQKNPQLVKFMYAACFYVHKNLFFFFGLQVFTGLQTFQMTSDE